MDVVGGGVRALMAYGASDEFSFTGVENRMHVHDLHEKILSLLGLDHENFAYRKNACDFRSTDLVRGSVAHAVIASGEADNHESVSSNVNSFAFSATVSLSGVSLGLA